NRCLQPLGHLSGVRTRQCSGSLLQVQDAGDVAVRDRSQYGRTQPGSRSPGLTGGGRGGPYNEPMDDAVPRRDGVTLGPGVVVPASALSFSFARGGGPGGQNVNKLATRATLTVRLDDLAAAMPADA